MNYAKFFLPVLVVALCGCSHDDKAAATPKAPPELKDVTDKSGCVGPATPGATIYNNWKKRFANDQMQIQMNWTITTTNNTNVTFTCYFPDGAQLDASFNVPSLVQGTQFMILSDGHNASHMQAGGTTYNCEGSLKAMTINFGFAGNCLAVTMPGGGTDYMVP